MVYIWDMYVWVYFTYNAYKCSLYWVDVISEMCLCVFHLQYKQMQPLLSRYDLWDVCCFTYNTYRCSLYWVDVVFICKCIQYFILQCRNQSARCWFKKRIPNNKKSGEKSMIEKWGYSWWNFLNDKNRKQYWHWERAAFFFYLPKSYKDTK